MKGKKTGGRQAGTPNKSTLDLKQRLDERFPGQHPVVAMAAMGYEELERIERGEVVTPDDMALAIEVLRKGDRSKWNAALKKLATAKALALDCLREVAQYVEPKRKAIEHSGEINEPMKLQITLNQVDAAEYAKPARHATTLEFPHAG